MIETLRNAWHVVEIRKRLFYMAVAAIGFRMCSQIPLPGVNRQYLSQAMDDMGLLQNGFLNAFTGGSLENMSIFALSITPYITASIIIQLLTIAIPKLEELSEEGEAGRKKLNTFTRYLTIGLALVEAVSLTIGLSNKHVFDGNAIALVTSVFVLTAGATYLMWLGEQLNVHGIGNGISFLLLVNIVSRMPGDIMALYEQFMKEKKIAVQGLTGSIIFAIIAALVIYVIVLNGAVRNIPVINSKRAGYQTGGMKHNIPIKVNTSGVLAVIFASSLLSFPNVIASLTGFNNYGSPIGKVLTAMNVSSWFDITSPVYTVGYLVYAVLVVFFAYFYTSININPRLMADDLKKQGSSIVGVRPGAETEAYITNVLRYITFIGAVGLLIAATFPFLISGIFHASVSFAGTSLIIVAGVCTEIGEQLDAMLVVRNYTSFLSSDGRYNHKKVQKGNRLKTKKAQG